MADKILAETKGDFMLMDVFSNQEIEAHRPCVVERSAFINARIGVGQVVVLANLKPQATDAELVKYITESKGDLELAVESFKSEFVRDEKLTKKAKGAAE